MPALPANHKKAVDFSLIYRRLGHARKERILEACRKSGIAVKAPGDFHCRSCHLGKAEAIVSRDPSVQATSFLQYIFWDFLQHTPTSSEGYRYTLHVVYEDPCVMTNRKLIIFFYVDDLVAHFRKEFAEEHARFKEAIGKAFEIKDLGDLRRFLNMEIVRDRANRRLWLSQRSYVQKVVAKFKGLTSYHQPLQPMTLEKIPPFEGSASETEIKTFQAIVGSLMYAAIITRADIAFAVGKLSRPGKAEDLLHKDPDFGPLTPDSLEGIGNAVFSLSQNLTTAPHRDRLPDPPLTYREPRRPWAVVSFDLFNFGGGYNGSLYLALFTDIFTGERIGHDLPLKSDLPSVWIKFTSFIKRRFDLTVSVILTDHKKALFTEAFQDNLAFEGIEIRFSSPAHKPIFLPDEDKFVRARNVRFHDPADSSYSFDKTITHIGQLQVISPVTDWIHTGESRSIASQTLQCQAFADKADRKSSQSQAYAIWPLGGIIA
ncbi:hypothetical protein L249_1770 [Ophiocordyceps polyrhachis-furcata BCC 54312]|uniref:Integrase catalytic domain-containing protein n=1 Tax=Ophiocordyceps polyrhachis-furcata BCC 54312 TaxID=1330021 RepID=A0A367LQZ3_9HYPO|nr:hypothetical protein L249_1770 [Ophiocordyceps polyrhachis-furcata BCC 54312]